MKDPEMRLSHQPEVQRRDVGIADECFWIAAKHARIEIGNDSHGTISTGRGDYCLDVGIAPHLHQTFRALLVLALMKAALSFDLCFENDVVPGLFHCLRSAKEPGSIRRVRGRDYSYGVTVLEWRRSRQRRQAGNRGRKCK